MLDVHQCLQQGLIGALGAIPGTIAAHPLDLTKIRLQIHPDSHLQQAIHQTIQAPFRGLSAGIQQKVLTRGPMFLCSEIGTQLCQTRLGMPRETALVVGSFGSGFATGCTASLSEWAKVQRGGSSSTALQPTNRRAFLPTMASSCSAWQLVRMGQRHGQLASVLRRVRGAGWRNAVFDSTFFGVEHQLRIRHELPAYASFSLAAATALCLDYPIDVAVKRNFAVAAHRPVSHGPILATIHHVRSEGRLIFRGLNVKGLEFAVSYFVTGAVAPLALRALAFAAAWIALQSEGNNDR